MRVTARRHPVPAQQARPAGREADREPGRGTAGPGELIARALAGSWRADPEPARLGLDDWKGISPLLLRTGAGGLGWWRLRNSELRNTACARTLHDAYRLHTLDARRHVLRLEDAIHALAAVGVEPLIAKGWVAARLYPEAGLRPYGDHDLFVPPEQHATAALALGSTQGGKYHVDLHAGVPEGSSEWREVWSRAELMRVGSTQIHTPAAEDHLRLLCLHQLGHGAWRPLWLCDVGATLESLPAGFDWDRFLGGNDRAADACVATLLLAGRLLGAKLEGTPLSNRELPSWLAPATLRAWGVGGHYTHTPPMALVSLAPSRVLAGLCVRWPNAVEATMRRGGRFNERPRLPLQAVDVISRLVVFGLAAPRALSQRVVRWWKGRAPQGEG